MSINEFKGEFLTGYKDYDLMTNIEVCGEINRTFPGRFLVNMLEDFVVDLNHNITIQKEETDFFPFFFFFRLSRKKPINIRSFLDFHYATTFRDDHKALIDLVDDGLGDYYSEENLYPRTIKIAKKWLYEKDKSKCPVMPLSENNEYSPGTINKRRKQNPSRLNEIWQSPGKEPEYPKIISELMKDYHAIKGNTFIEEIDGLFYWTSAHGRISYMAGFLFVAMKRGRIKKDISAPTLKKICNNTFPNLNMKSDTPFKSIAVSPPIEKYYIPFEKIIPELEKLTD